MSGLDSRASNGELHPSTPVVKLMFDGGSKGNPGQGYGSFIYWGFIEQMQPQQVDFPGRLTNNQSEYRTLIVSLERVLEELDQVDQDPATVAIQVRSDSQLVVSQINGRFKVKNTKLKPLHAKAVALLSRFKSNCVEWHSRSESVRWLGH